MGRWTPPKRLAILSILVVGCTGSGVANPSSPARIDATPTPVSTPADGGASSSSPGSCADPASVTSLHDVPDLERVLPASVAGRKLATWSVKGRCWVEMATGGTGLDVDEVVAKFDALSSAPPIDLNSQLVTSQAVSPLSPRPYGISPIDRGPRRRANCVMTPLSSQRPRHVSPPTVSGPFYVSSGRRRAARCSAIQAEPTVQ
jgi:hypothetical protein